MALFSIIGKAPLYHAVIDGMPCTCHSLPPSLSFHDACLTPVCVCLSFFLPLPLNLPRSVWFHQGPSHHLSLCQFVDGAAGAACPACAVAAASTTAPSSFQGLDASPLLDVAAAAAAAASAADAAAAALSVVVSALRRGNAITSRMDVAPKTTNQTINQANK